MQYVPTQRAREDTLTRVPPTADATKQQRAPHNTIGGPLRRSETPHALCERVRWEEQ